MTAENKEDENMTKYAGWDHNDLAEAVYELGYENAFEMSEHELRDILYDHDADE